MPDLFTPPPKAPRSYRPGQKHEHAKQTRDASYREHKASGTAATQREQLLRYYADPRLIKDGYDDVSDKEAAAYFTHDAKPGTPPTPASTISARRKELLTADDGPLVERGAKRECRVTGRTVTPWRLTARGREALAQLGAIR